MPVNADLRQAITIAVEAENTDAVGRLRADMQELINKQEDWRRKLAEGNATGVEAAKGISALGREYKILDGLLMDLLASEGAALRARAEMAAGTERAAEATSAAVRASVDQQIADHARLQAALGAMESRDAADRASGVANPRAAQAIADATQVYDAEAALQAKLRQMRDAADQQAVQGAQATAAARRKGTEAVVEHIAAVRQEVKAEEEARAAAIKAMGDRAREYAKAEQALEAFRAAQKRAADQATSNANAKTWVDKQKSDIDQLLQDMAVYEATSKRAWVAAAPGQSQVDAVKKYQAAIAEMGMAQTMGYAGMKKATDDAQRLADANQRGAGSAKDFGYGMLIFSHAIQDAQYGIGAVLNNIPLMVQALGGGPGLAGTVMIAAVAFEVFKPKITAAAREMGLLADPTRKAATSVADLEAKIAALNEKPLKLAPDIALLESLNRKLAETKKAVDEWNALKGQKTGSQERAASLIKEGIVEGGGAQNVENAIAEIMKRNGTFSGLSPSQPKLDALRNTLQGAMDDKTGAKAWALAVWESWNGSIKGHIAAAEKQVEVDAKTRIASMIEKAPTDESQRAKLEKMFIENQDVFAKNKVNPKFGAALVMASPENRDSDAITAQGLAEEKRKAELDKKIDARRQKEDAAHQQQVNAAASSVKDAFDDQLTDRLYGTAKGGGDMAAARGKEFAGLVAGLAARKVDSALINDVAAQILDKAQAAALNAVASGDPPKLVKERAAADRKVQGQEARDLNKGVAAVDQDFLPFIENFLARNRLAQAQGAPVVRSRREEEAYIGTGTPYALPEAEMRRRLQRDVGGRLRATGQDPAVADELIGRGQQNVDQRTSAVMGNNVTIQEGLVGAVAATDDAVARLAQKQQAIIARLGGMQQNTRMNRRQLGNMQVQQPALGNVIVPMGGGF